MKYILLLFFMCAMRNLPIAQPSINLPGNTGYAVPAEREGVATDIVFDEEKGAVNWLNAKQTLHYFFYVKEAGAVEVSVTLVNESKSSALQWFCNRQQHLIPFPSAAGSATVKAGRLSFDKPGFYELVLSPVNKSAHRFPSIEAVQLNGPIAASIHANQKPRRNAASVHLKYPLSDTVKAVGFYNELTVPVGKDPLHSYYMACGFSRGYFGMQVNSAKERRIIFSIWDSGTEADDRNKVKDQDKVKLTGKGESVIAEDFGNEGTGGHSHWVYPWKTGITYRFYVTALPDSNDTYYSGYFFVPELQKWKLIASFKAPHDGHYLKDLYSFVEDFDGSNGQLHRKALFGNQWVQEEDRQWIGLNKARFSYDATGRAGDRIDYDGGIENGRFFLSNGGFIKGSTRYDSMYIRTITEKSPLADLYKNADSAATALKEKKLIFEAVAAGKLDTTGSMQGLYYKLLSEGTGRQVKLSDTVTAFYKGALLSGEVFDQTENEPASFPLGRLIKGWQIGLPLCRVGGKIRLIVPSALAYSIRTRSSNIPPNSVLVFDLEVTGAK